LMIETAHPPVAVTFERLLARRATREPLQHILGRTWFRHVEIAVGPGVFVPRPETELLVDAVLPALRATGEPTVVDLCSGSGALALALVDEVPAARVVAVECDREALVWLRRNTGGSRVEVYEGDVTDADLLAELRGAAHAVVCNPPYVPSETEVDPEVRHDPSAAVFAGPDGLELLPAVLARAAELLASGGVFAVEHDETHELAVPQLFERDGRWQRIADHRDLAGRSRYVTAVRT